MKARPEERTLAAAQSVHADIAEQARGAREALDRAARDLEKRETELARSQQAHVDGGSGDAVHAADRELRLAQLRHESVKRKAEQLAADEANAKGAVDRAALEVRKASLREQASPEAFHAAADTAVLAIAELAHVIAERAAKIAAARDSSNAAAKELRALGEHTPDLSHQHVALAALDALADSGRTAGTYDLNQLSTATIGDGTALAGQLLQLFAKKPWAAAPAVASFREKLRRIRVTRTSYEATALEHAETGGAGYPGASSRAARAARPLADEPDDEREEPLVPPELRAGGAVRLVPAPDGGTMQTTRPIADDRVAPRRDP